jgi:hypothetical protein
MHYAVVYIHDCSKTGCFFAHATYHYQLSAVVMSLSSWAGAEGLLLALLLPPPRRMRLRHLLLLAAVLSLLLVAATALPDLDEEDDGPTTFTRARTRAAANQGSVGDNEEWTPGSENQEDTQ